ncbi:MAG: type II methionyl aminopeptidase [Candidatus Eiseniibacteriota bacterium]|jgi:methionyl aminopeptidase
MDSFDSYLEAGRIASRIRERVRKVDFSGKNLYDICENIEKDIISNAGIPAFPVNVSLNEIAAHYTAEPGDPTVVSNDDVLKVDIGVQVNGFIADTAVTVSSNAKYQAMVASAESALNEAIKMAKIDVSSSAIGEVIERTISRSGFKPIQNLSGHSIEQYTIHAGKSIPNIRTFGSSFQLTANQAYAIEPFVTTRDAQGVVYEGKIRNIFGVVSRKPTKDKNCDDFLQNIWDRFKTLPFTTRWLLSDYYERDARKMLEVLLKRKNIHAYPILVEGNYKVVAQAEHTIILKDNNTEIITL